MFQSLVMTADLIMLHAGYTLLVHFTVVSYPVFRELTFLFYKYIKHHPCHGEAEENNG